MPVRTFFTALAGLAAAGAVTGPALAQTRLAAFHAGLSPAEYAAAVQAQILRDQADCRTTTAADGSDQLTVTATAPSLLGAVVAGVVAGAVSQAIAASRDDGRDTPGMRACMGRSGYKPLALTPAQLAERRALRGEARDQWVERTVRFTPASNSESYAVMMWDVEENRPVSVHRDPASGDYKRTWTFNR